MLIAMTCPPFAPCARGVSCPASPGFPEWQRYWLQEWTGRSERRRGVRPLGSSEGGDGLIQPNRGLESRQKHQIVAVSHAAGSRWHAIFTGYGGGQVRDVGRWHGVGVNIYICVQVRAGDRQVVMEHTALGVVVVEERAVDRGHDGRDEEKPGHHRCPHPPPRL